MRILQINNYGYIRGGSDRYFIELGKCLSKKGNDVVFFCSRDSRNIVDVSYAVKGFNIDAPAVTDIGRFFYSIDAKNKLKSLIKEQRPDIAHLHIYYGQITPSILPVLKDNDIPVVQTLHEYKLFCPISLFVREGIICEKCAKGSYWNVVRYRCNRGSLMRSVVSGLEAYFSDLLGARNAIDHFIAVSNFQRKKVIEHGISPAKVTTVYNFVPDEMFSDNDQPGEYFLYYGRIEKIKGIGTLINAMERLRQFNLYIVGRGEALGIYERMVKEKGLDNVKFCGFKAGYELKKIIAGALCVVVPSEWYETFGLTVVESFAQCKPVIVSNMGGLPELVTDGVDGFIFESGNVEQLREKMYWIAIHKKEAVEMGKMGQEKAKERFSSKKHYEAVMKIYNKVLTLEGAG